MRYEKVDTHEISFKCSETASFNLFNTFDIPDKRNVQPLSLPNSTNKLYSERRKLKKQIRSRDDASKELCTTV